MSEKLHIPNKAPADTPKLNERGLEYITEEEQKAWRLLVPYLRLKSIKLSSFEGYVDPNILKSDSEYVERIERKFETETPPGLLAAQRRAEILEAILAENIKHAKWLGPQTEPIIASRYDDIANGVDLILEILEDQKFEYLALNVDVTSSTAQVDKKLSDIKDMILEGDLTEVKYFQSKKSGITGRKDNVPKVIIGIDADALKELSLIRVELNTFRNALKKPENSSPNIQKSLAEQGKKAALKLGSHRIQFLIFSEMEIQIEKFIEFADKNNKPEIAEKYQGALNTIRALKNRPGAPQLSEEDKDRNNNDQIFIGLKEALKNF